MSDITLSTRARQVVLAAVEVLGKQGAAGLTHRAVDRQADLAEGSTSNLFRTRTALVDAICRFLTDHDLERLDKASQRFASESQMTAAKAAEGLAAIIHEWTTKEAVFTAARLELFLIAHRDPKVASELAQVRRTFRERGIEWLERVSKGAGQHVALVMATIEGLTSNQLLHPAARMSREELKRELTFLLNSLTR